MLFIKIQMLILYTHTKWVINFYVTQAHASLAPLLACSCHINTLHSYRRHIMSDATTKVTSSHTRKARTCNITYEWTCTQSAPATSYIFILHDRLHLLSSILQALRLLTHMKLDTQDNCIQLYKFSANISSQQLSTYLEQPWLSPAQELLILDYVCKHIWTSEVGYLGQYQIQLYYIVVSLCATMSWALVYWRYINFLLQLQNLFCFWASLKAAKYNTDVV